MTEQPYKDYGEVDLTEHELEMVEKQCEKTNEQLEDLGI